MRVPSLSTARFAVLVALVLALFTSGIVVGAAGAPLILGQSNSSGGSRTTVQSSSTDGTMKVTNTGSGRALEVVDGNKPPLRIAGPNDEAPMVVNSTKKVSNLNADRLDNFSARNLVRASYDQSFADVVLPAAASPATLVSTTMTLPGPGYVIVQATATPYGFVACSCEVAFAVTDGDTTSLYQRAQIGSNADSTEIANVSAQYVFTYAEGGAQTFNLQGLNFGAGTSDIRVTYRSITALYVPFGSTGNVPAAAGVTAAQPVAPSGR
jgi:hypothetical protein